MFAFSLSLLTCAAPAACVAPLQDVEVEVRVLAVRGNVVEIDRGTNAGAEPGDVVVLRPLGQPEVRGTVRSVSADAATVVLSAAVSDLAPGAPGILRLPADRFPDPNAARVEGLPPPVWHNPDDQWEDGLPLLAEVTGPRPDERPSTWTGRGTLGGYFLKDDGALPRDDAVGRVGLALEGQNPFGRGGRMHVGVELRAERTDFSDPALEDDSNTFLRVDELSYEWGGTRDEPRRYEVGRFLQYAFPELGLLDGVEASQRLDNGVRIGASVGSQPALDRERSVENAPQVALWALIPFAEERRGELGLALQETWFDGQQDRDLFLARARWTDGLAWRADATTWIDLYRSDDVGKSSGAELTEARASLTRTFESGAGARLDLSQVKFPSLRRYRAQDFTAEELRDANTTTASFSTWVPHGDRGTWNGRIGVWTDDEADGGWADVGYDRRFDGDVIDRGSGALFYSDNRDGNIVGVRTRVSGPGLGGRWSAGLDFGLYDRLDTNGGTDQLQQGALRAGWSGAFGDGWYLYLDGAQRFGDDQDAISLDFTLQRSF
ncbi:MAG: hypothetical protein R3F49_16765 [Planctomycetota bacterium]